MSSDPPAASAITRSDWLDRYKQRFIEIADLSEKQAQALSEADSFDVLSEGFENDPKGAADEEMSYWEDDFDGTY